MLSGQRLGINHDEARRDFIWENVTEIVAAVLAVFLPVISPRLVNVF